MIKLSPKVKQHDYLRNRSKTKTESCVISLTPSNDHPLIRLARVIPWTDLADIVLPDLKKTPTGKWWLGRKLQLRIHLGVYLLQLLFNKTDRQTEWEVKDNAAYQIFCGFSVVENWHCPDHTKIEEFRSRLSPEG